MDEAGSGAGVWTEPHLPGQVPGPLGWPFGHNCFENPFFSHEVSKQTDVVLTSHKIFEGEVLYLQVSLLLQIQTSARQEFKFISKSAAPAQCCRWLIVRAINDSETEALRRENNYLGKGIRL